MIMSWVYGKGKDSTHSMPFFLPNLLSFYPMWCNFSTNCIHSIGQFLNTSPNQLSSRLFCSVVRMLYSFSRAAITNYPKLGDLTEFCLSQFWKPEVLTRSRALFLLGAPGKSPFFASCRVWWLLVFLDLWSHHFNICLHGHVASSSSPRLLFCLTSSSAFPW